MFLIKILKNVKNHWKKSTFAAGALAYGISYSNEKYEINELMRKYCEEAEKYGDVTQNVLLPSKRIVVILNPAANKKSAEKMFQKYCEPILHLSGMIVDVIKTDSEGYARRYVEKMEKLPDAILVAGGDGTLSETVTGLMRRSTNDKCPVGILPLGQTNSVAKKVHNFNVASNNSNINEIHDLAESAMSVVRGRIQKKDVMQIHQIEEKKEEEKQIKPIYAMGSLQWGAFRDVKSLKDKYWYVGPFREYVSALLNAFNDKLTWNCKAKLSYTPPCLGCSNCFIKPSIEQKQKVSTGRWWSNLIPKFRSQPLGSGTYNIENSPDHSKIINENCSQVNHLEINSTELFLSANNPVNTNNDDNNNSSSKLEVYTDNPVDSKLNFITENWHRINSKDEIKHDKKEVEARTIELIPESLNNDDNEIFYSIDSEAYEVKPIRIVLIPKAIELYT